jgi:AraC-like DNA-binding protein
MRDMDGLLFSAFLTTVLAVVSHIAVQGTPDLFSELGPAIQKADRISRLSGLNLNNLQTRLVRLMEEERLYQEDDLTLARLSEELDVKPYQLSEYLNSYLDQNFSRFVNGYRVAAAARMLLEEADASVLSIAFRVGFNSKANFNLAFKSILGLAPRDYVRRERRKRNIGAPSSRAMGATVPGRQKS